MQDTADDAARIAALREALPATASGIQLDVMGGGPLPAETARAMAEADDWELRTGRGGIERLDDAAQRADEARGVLAALLGVDPDELALTHGMAEAIALAEQVAGGQSALRVVPHVDPATGRTLTPADAAVAAETRPWLLDAGNTAGALAVRAPETGAGFVAIAGNRWLLGPEGSGALWVDRRVADRVALDAATARLDPLPLRSALGLARSVGWLEMYLGLPWLYGRTAQVAQRLRERLAAIDGVELATPIDDPGAIAVFSIRGWRAAQARRELGARCFAVLGPPVDEVRLRVSVGAWNTDDEADRLCDVVALLAAHDAATLPRRPGLVVLGSTDRQEDRSGDGQ